MTFTHFFKRLQSCKLMLFQLQILGIDRLGTLCGKIV